MSKRRWMWMMPALIVSSACFHQVVQTGRAPGSTTVDKPWVSTWIFGLVPAAEIDVRKECPSGAATIVTEQSFVNGLVAAVTLGIYTPQHVTITCASGSSRLPDGARQLAIPAGATREQSAAVLDHAIELANETNAPVVIRF